MMMLHKFNLRFLNGGLLAAMVAVGLVGCGGSSSNGVPRRDTVPLEGGVVQSNATLDTTVPTSPNGQTVSINGGTDTAYLAPTTEPVPAGTTLTIIPQGTQFFSGLTRSGSRAPGDVWVNGRNTGVTVDENGELSENIAVVNNRSYEVFVQGALTIRRGGKELTISEGFGFNVVVRGNVASLPFAIDGTIPSNGGTAADMFLSVAYPQPFTDDSVTLTVEKSNGDVSQTRTLQATTENEVTAGFATFRDFVPDVVVPAEGVQRVDVRFTEN